MTLEEMITYVTLNDMLIENQYLGTEPDGRQDDIYRLRFRGTTVSCKSVATILHAGGVVIHCSLIIHTELGMSMNGEVPFQEIIDHFF